ncbi:MAG: DNA adenine methylase [Archangium sp.]|nr:DNA adenine methylase [Archangium sp.]
MNAPLRAPFPWFGGKSRAADLVWRAFGSDIPNYVEPFAGSMAVLLARPGEPRIETVNDKDCYLANFWRALKHAPQKVAEFADWPVNETDLHARHLWLVKQSNFRERMRRNPKYFDARIAGWWVWGLCQWIGSGWCDEANWNPSAPRLRGSLAKNDTSRPNLQQMGVHKRTRRLATSATWAKRPQLGKGGRGVSRQMPMLRGDSGAAGAGIHASGLYRKLPGLSLGLGTGAGVHSSGPLFEWMHLLAERLRRVRVCCGDWKRVLSRSATEHIGVTGILLDPPYSGEVRDASLYACESGTISGDVREWAIANGDNEKLRIALCGYEGEHDMPATWTKVPWKAVGGYAASAGNTENSARERIWFSPHCYAALAQRDLFGGAA